MCTLALSDEPLLVTKKYIPMKRINNWILIIAAFFLLTSQETFGQSERVAILDRGPIEAQFNEVITKSSRYQDFKVVKETWLNTLRSHVNDTIANLKRQLNDARKLTATHQGKVDSLNNQLSSVNTELTQVHGEKDSMKFLFFSVGKDTYNRIVWTFVGILIIALLVFILLFKRSSSIINQAKADLEEKKQEFDAFRKRALERESQLSRNYLNELNKYKNL